MLVPAYCYPCSYLLQLIKINHCLNGMSPTPTSIGSYPNDGLLCRPYLYLLLLPVG